MNTVYVKFNSRKHQVEGYYALATHATVTSLPDGVYVVPVQALSILDDQEISYRQASEDEVEKSNAQPIHLWDNDPR